MTEQLKNESLRQKQSRFAHACALLILFAEAKGFAVTFGETYRPEREAAANAAAGTGIKASLHVRRLAVDLNAFNTDGKYLEDTVDYLPLGEFWESLGTDYYWGGRFTKKPDGNHFSLSPDGGRTR